VGFPLPPLTATVTVKGCAVVMLAADGVTVTVGVISAGMAYFAVTVALAFIATVQVTVLVEVHPLQELKVLPPD
jgi:hypothetical protein